MQKVYGTIATGILAAALLVGCSGAGQREAKYMQQGKTFYKAGNYEDARVSFRNVLQIDPKNAKAYYEMGLTLRKLQSWNGAAGAFKKSLELDPSSNDTAAELGELYLLARRPDLALQQAGDILKRQPTNIRALNLRAAALGIQGHADEALQQARKNFAAAPDNLDAGILLATLYKQQGKLEAADKLLHELINKHPDATGPVLMLSHLDQERNDLNGAASQMDAVIKLNPDDLGYYLQRAVISLKQKNPKAGAALIQSYIAKHPDDQQAKFRLINFVARTESIEAALKRLNAFIAAAPDDQQLQLYKAQFLVQSNHKKKGKALLEELAKSGDSKTSDSALNSLARIAYSDKELDKAGKYLSQVLDDNPNDQDALMLRGTIAYDQKHYPEAIADFRVVTKNNPNSENAFKRLGQALIAHNEQHLAADALNKAVSLAPGDDQVHMALASLYRNQGNIDKAEQQYDFVLNRHPKDAQLLETLAQLHIASKKWEEARHEVERLNAIPGQSALGHYLDGQIKEGQGDHDQALKAYDESLADNPRAVEPLNAKIKLLMNLGRSEVAEKWLQAWLKQYPKNDAASNLLGQVYIAQKKPEKAIIWLEKAEKENANWWLPYRSLGMAYAMMDKTDQALDTMRKGYGKTHNKLLGMELADMYDRAGHADKAIEFYREMRMNGDNSDAVANNLAMLLVEHHKDADSLNEAKVLAQQIMGSNNPMFLDTAGWVFYKTGDYDQALSIIRRAVQRSPDEPELNYHLGMVFNALNQKQNATTYLKKAIASPKSFLERNIAERKLATLNKGVSHKDSAVE